MSHDPSGAKARRKVSERLAPLLGADAARDAAEALGGNPGDIAYNGEALAKAIEARVPKHLLLDAANLCTLRGNRGLAALIMHEWEASIMETQPVLGDNLDLLGIKRKG